MVTLGTTKAEDRSRAPKYRAVGSALLRTARDLATMAEPKYGNGLAIVAIHSAIAYVDALTIAYRETKSTDGDHRRAADVLEWALGSRTDAGQMRRLRGILDAKSHASYSGNWYTLEDGLRLVDDVEAFATWAESLLTARV